MGAPNDSRPDEHRPEDGSSAPWIRRAVRGEATAPDWEALFERYRPKLTVYADRQLGPELRQRFDADDVVQQAWMAVIQRIQTFEYRGRGSLLAWLRIQIRRRVGDLARRGHHESEGAIDIPSSEPGVESVLANAELRGRLLESLDTLPRIYREVVEARYIEGRAVVAIARAQGKKPDTVSQQIRRGLKLWQQAFGGEPSSLLVG